LNGVTLGYVELDPVLQRVYVYANVGSNTCELWMWDYGNSTGTKVTTFYSCGGAVSFAVVPGNGLFMTFQNSVIRLSANISAGFRTLANINTFGYLVRTAVIAYNPLNDTIFWWIQSTSAAQPSYLFWLPIADNLTDIVTQQNTSNIVFMKGTCDFFGSLAVFLTNSWRRQQCIEHFIGRRPFRCE
jgi:hypothetical protein